MARTWGWARGSGRRGGGERGQALPLVAVALVVAGVACLGVARVAGIAVDAAQAATAADAAALAGAAEGRRAAEELAEAGGARLVSFAQDGLEVRVVVERRGRRASARAEAVGGAGGVGDVDGLTPAMRAALARAERALGTPVPITSGFRSRAEQERLWANRGSNRFPVARPGSSAHERGTAVDVPRAFAERLARVGPSVGLCRPLPRTDPIHFELCRAAG